VALIAQSGSAAISLINSTMAGWSKVITMGSEFQVTAPDYMRWLAEDAATEVVGIVLESIRSPENFATAARRLRAAGKSLVVLHVGKSEVGALAVQAHTGAMISRRDAFERFFDQCGIPTVQDYDELVASIECLAAAPPSARGPRAGIVGISGGETALATDVAADLGLPVASWSAATAERVRAALPGASGVNPLDLGATVHHSIEQADAAISAILEDPSVDSLLVVQDAQASLTPTMLGNYMPRILLYGRHGAASGKPVVLVSPTGENAHPRIIEALSGQRVPVLRGLRAGMVALRNLGILGQATAPLHGGGTGPSDAVTRALRDAIDSAAAGPLPAALCSRILSAYDIPVVRSMFAASPDVALAAAADIGFPLVLKIASPDIPHRSDVGGVERGVREPASLRDAIERMLRNVRDAAPHAWIAGFELQQELIDHVEAMAGFIAAPPFGALTVVGTGGTLVELDGDRVVELGRFPPAHAAAMIGRTRLGARLAGYRNLMPKTDSSELAGLLSRLSDLAADFADRIGECDLNPVLIRPRTGEATVVDALMVKTAPAGQVGEA
jgi:acetyltransferase